MTPPATDEDQLSLGVFGVHVEGIARGLTNKQGATPVCHKHQVIQIVRMLPRNLDNGFSIKQFNFISGTVCITNNWRPDISIAELDAGEKDN